MEGTGRELQPGIYAMLFVQGYFMYLSNTHKRLHTISSAEYTFISVSGLGSFPHMHLEVKSYRSAFNIGAKSA